MSEVSMVERVARAAAGLAEGSGQAGYIDKVWPSFIPFARAAILAMRERDEAMLDAGTAVLWPHVQQFSPGSTAVAVYTAMIDAALKE